MRVLGLVFGALSLLLASCSEDFAPYNRLSSLRVLAIQSEPVAPAYGEQTVLAAHVFTPGAETVRYEWSWCPLAGPAETGYACLLTEAELSEQLGAEVTFALGTTATVAFTHVIPPEALEAVCSGSLGGTPPIDCASGYPVSIRLRVATANDEVLSVRTLRLRYRDDQPPVQNPVLMGLRAVIDDSQRVIDEQGLIVLPRDVETALQAVLPEAASESYLGEDDDGNPAQLLEQLTLTWFVESGTTRSERTSFIPGSLTFAAARANEWTPAPSDEYAPSIARIRVVVRDDRGGVGWYSGRVQLGEDGTP